VVVVTLLATGITIVLAAVYGRGQPSCGSYQPGPGWANGVESAALISTLVGLACAAVALLRRRWIVALVSVVANAAALVFMAASSCAFY
jgi:hypothetical protein